MPPRVSVIVASRKRPRWLARCLASLRQLDYPAFEIVVVADADSLGRVDASGLRTVGFEDANLSAARNAGVRHAAGELCAFIDDDAVAEPGWLGHHAAAIAATGAAASVGFVRGRNGISLQSRAASIDTEAETHDEPVAGPGSWLPALAPGRAVKLVGTNTLIRRETFLGLGGFDPAFAYYLEDGDLSLRFAAAGGRAAVAPAAEVHHGFAPSPRRTGQRTPRDLSDIGRSSAIFFRKHFRGDAAELFERLWRRERQRLLRHMVRGGCEPRDVARVLATLRRGWDEGSRRALAGLEPLSGTGEAFLPVAPLPPGHEVFAARYLRRRSRLAEAAMAARSGRRASLFSFSLTPVRHHVRYTDSGVWMQTGGQFGRADRGDPLLRWCTFAERLGVEISRVANARGMAESC